MGITKPCTHLYPAPFSSAQLISTSDPVKHLRWNFFHKSLLGFRGEFRILSNIGFQSYGCFIF